MSTDADNRRGAGLMMASMAAFTINDVFVKAAATDLSLGQILLLRGVIAIAVLLLLARRFHALRRVPARDARLIALRCAAEIGAAYFFLTALLALPIANVTAILQSVPLTVTLCAALFLGEAVGWRRWSAIAAGFVGMLLITRPGTGDFTLASVYVLIAVGFVTLRDLVTRRMSVAVPSLLVTLSAAIAVTLFSVGLTAVQGWSPMTPRLSGLVLGSALFVTAGYFLSVAAMRVGDVGAVAPFRYTSLIWALVLGWAVFGEWPEPLTFAGAAIIVGAGVFTLRRGRAVRTQTRIPAGSGPRPR
ncbi:S-adenosylmethionine uptake transporter [Roseivivax lentus]|uniref:S-adenosylmethionine uptake transporter n=1 Tax=Roseivivax lentus TaxID=633194 RepID=A0A1N7NEP7_9RHOB|nr:DMT family transporter [Roseivivax lentus]SIS96649.1 S-adenosylmethionine uptake transporter [Roseivivax lentus]